jgi:hypothetical protein
MLGPLIAAVAPTLIGSALGFAGDRLAASDARSSAENANAFTEKQMKSRHQWEVEDLRKAGLNPVLSAGGTPSMGSSAMAPVINPTNGIMQGASSGLAVKEMENKLKNDEKLREKTVAETEKTWADVGLSGDMRDTQLRQQELLRYQAANAKVDAARNYMNYKHEAKVDVLRSKVFDKAISKGSDFIQRLKGLFND